MDGGPPDGGPPNVLFVTSTVHAGDLGGLAPYDAICAHRARVADLSGTFVALLSTTDVYAVDRIRAARGWVNTAGEPFADSWEDLVAGQTFGPVLDERGRNVPAAAAWTGSTEDLAPYPSATCSDWTSTDGNGSGGLPDEGTGAVFSVALWTCESALRVYCAQVDHHVEVAPTPVPGRARRIFVSTGVWDGAGGLAAADANCNVAARAADVPGSYVALLADVGASALSRLRGPSVPWVRLDGALVWDPAVGPADASTLVISPSMTADGSYYSRLGEWTGALSPAIAGTVETTCGGWALPRPAGARAQHGLESRRDLRWFSGVTDSSCDGAARTYCIEQLDE